MEASDDGRSEDQPSTQRSRPCPWRCSMAADAGRDKSTRATSQRSCSKARSSATSWTRSCTSASTGPTGVQLYADSTFGSATGTFSSGSVARFAVQLGAHLATGSYTGEFDVKTASGEPCLRSHTPVSFFVVGRPTVFGAAVDLAGRFEATIVDPDRRSRGSWTELLHRGRGQGWNELAARLLCPSSEDLHDSSQGAEPLQSRPRSAVPSGGPWRVPRTLRCRHRGAGPRRVERQLPALGSGGGAHTGVRSGGQGVDLAASPSRRSRLPSRRVAAVGIQAPPRRQPRVTARPRRRAHATPRKGPPYDQVVRYAEQVERYVEAFPPELLRVIVFEEWIDDPQSVLGEVIRFLGVEPVEVPPLGSRSACRAVPERRRPAPRHDRSQLGFDPPNRRVRRRGLELLHVANRVGGPRPRLDPELRARLAEHFAPEVDRLHALLGREVPAWRPPPA